MSNNIPLNPQQILRKPCPKESCDCGYYSLVPDLSKTFVDPEIQRFQGLIITRMQEGIIVKKIGEITTLDEFYDIREILRREYRITFLVE